MATAPARRRLHTAPDSDVRVRPTKVRGGGRPAWVTDDLVAEEMDESARLATRRGKAADKTREGARDAGRRAAKPWGRKRPAGGGTTYTPGRASVGPRGVSWSGARVSTDAAGVILAVFTWTWVILPALRGGPGEVKNTLRAKFLNKSPDGAFLP